jgi:hypothetical protein
MKLTVPQVAKRTNVCAAVVYGWCSARLLPHFRVGMPGHRGKLLIEEADLDAFLESCRVGPKAASVPPLPRKKRSVTLRNLRLPS